jgi:beta-lactamase superfamily II metal-dependent hydrolase
MPKLQPPDGGVTVRMYRQGHGDCFLLALPREGGGDPVYVVIDCGYKPGSQAFVHDKPIGDTVKHLFESSGGRIDLMVLTHEHQDHLNGIWKKINPFFKDFTIDEAWLAWTEDPDDDLANELRERHHDQLLGLLEARRKLALSVGEQDGNIRQLDALLSFEFGSAEEAFTGADMLAAAADPAASVNKQGMKLVKDKASENRGVSYLKPGDGPITVPGTAGIRVFVLGPPHDADLLADEDPHGAEGFPDDHAFTFSAAATAGAGAGVAPFSNRFAVPAGAALQDPQSFFSKHYGTDSQGVNDADRVEVPDDAAWRRIEQEWLYSAENLALALNTGINNTSLVLAFELPASKKVLFFAGDAQRGNWISWTVPSWQDGGQTIKARDLLARTVLYKVGHHGSHNATLAGTLADAYANLSWMATTPACAKEFTAMITAVNEWALTKNAPPWRHPLPSIKEALLRKTDGRVFQTDEDAPTKPSTVTAGAWKAFTDRAVFDQLFFDYTILDA